VLNEMNNTFDQAGVNILRGESTRQVSPLPLWNVLVQLESTF